MQPLITAVHSGGAAFVLPALRDDRLYATCDRPVRSTNSPEPRAVQVLTADRSPLTPGASQMLRSRWSAAAKHYTRRSIRLILPAKEIWPREPASAPNLSAARFPRTSCPMAR